MSTMLAGNYQEYEQFLSRKKIVAERSGIEAKPAAVNPMLYDFQRDLVLWALKRGRAAIFADCGLGKTLMQLEWARIIGDTVLIVAPLVVNEQTIMEGRKIGVEVRNVRDGSELKPGINITNYEMIRHFIDYVSCLTGIVLDESSILKSIDGKTRKILLDNFTSVPYRLCCTATPCPNDIAEIANHSQFLGFMSRQEMLASFFVHDEDGWRLRGYAKQPLYRWLASWSMALKSPSDLGYDGTLFALPKLNIIDCVVNTTWRKPGELYPGKLSGITDRISVRKSSLNERIAAAAKIANETEGQVIVWCGLNLESDGVSDQISDSVNLEGNDSRETKKETILNFVAGKIRVLVTKPKVAGFGMNFQNASTMIFLGLSDSYEAYYQCIRRSWRFGQKNPVDVHVVVSDHEEEIVENVRSKEREAELLSSSIIKEAREYEMEELGKQNHEETIETAEYSGEGWNLYQGDSCVEMKRLNDDSIDLSIFSPPFISLYTYSATDRDMGNCKDDQVFMEHFGFIIQELLRVTRPGRLCCVHVAQIATTMVNHGIIGMKDFRGMVCNDFVNRGWIYHGEVCIDKDPQAQAIRTHSKGLLFVQLKKDASWLRPAMADYILVFRKPGENQVPIHPDIDNNEWIEWARPIWYGIRESDTLNKAEARANDDDRHICPLQLGTIERVIRLWSNPGETVFSPFAGIGSEGYEALRNGRRFIGIELKPLYAKTAASNLEKSIRKSSSQGGLFPVEAAK